MSLMINTKAKAVPLFLVISSLLLSEIVGAVEFSDKSEKHAGIGAGFGIVKFDTNFKFTNKTTGDSVFVDAEGTLDLPEISNVNTIYAAYSFNKRHSIGFAHFRIDREATLFEANLNFDDLILIMVRPGYLITPDFTFLTMVIRSLPMIEAVSPVLLVYMAWILSIVLRSMERLR